jgi:hypothetical protein
MAKSYPNTINIAGSRGTTMAKSQGPDRGNEMKANVSQQLGGSKMGGDKASLSHSISGASVPSKD